MKKYHLGTGGISCLCGVDEDNDHVVYSFSECTCKTCLKIAGKKEYDGCYGRIVVASNTDFNLTQSADLQVKS